MSHTITFVTESHTFGEDSRSSAIILDKNDVQGIANEVANRVRDESLDNIKRLSKSLDEVHKSIKRAQELAEESKRSVGAFVDNVRETFTSAIEEILRPQYETLAKVLEAATAPTAPEVEFYVEAIKSLTLLSEAMIKSQSDTIAGFAAINAELSKIHAGMTVVNQSIAKKYRKRTDLCNQTSNDVLNPPKRKWLNRLLFWHK